MVKPTQKEMAAPPGQFIALRAFNALKEAIFGYVMYLVDLIKKRYQFINMVQIHLCHFLSRSLFDKTPIYLQLQLVFA